jgi:preprotein translocase subunit SecY
VLAMGVYPYITAQIIIQLLVPIIPALQKRMQDDPREGQKWMEKWTYILTSADGGPAGYWANQHLLNSLVHQVTPILNNFGFSGANFLPSITIILAMTAGTMFAIWLGELISEYGIRNQGLSLIIFAGIVSQIPGNLASLMADEQNRWSSWP